METTKYFIPTFILIIFLTLACSSPKQISNANSPYATRASKDKSIEILVNDQNEQYIKKGSEGSSEHTLDFNNSRKVIHRDYSMIRTATSKSGLISMQVCINPAGIVTFVKIDNSETTIEDKKLQRHALESLINYKYEADPDAPEEQCGKYKLKIDTVH